MALPVCLPQLAITRLRSHSHSCSTAGLLPCGPPVSREPLGPLRLSPCKQLASRLPPLAPTPFKCSPLHYCPSYPLLRAPLPFCFSALLLHNPCCPAPLCARRAPRPPPGNVVFLPKGAIFIDVVPELNADKHTWAFFLGRDYMSLQVGGGVSGGPGPGRGGRRGSERRLCGGGREAKGDVFNLFG